MKPDVNIPIIRVYSVYIRLQFNLSARQNCEELPIFPTNRRNITLTKGRRSSCTERSTIGNCLTEALDQMVEEGTLPPELAIQVLLQFDKSMIEALENNVGTKISIKGHLHSYRFVDNVWTFEVKDALFKSEVCVENVSSVKIVACDSQLLN